MLAQSIRSPLTEATIGSFRKQLASSPKQSIVLFGIFELLGISAARTRAHIFVGERPRASTDLFMEQSPLGQYDWHILALVALLISETLLIVGLLVNRARWVRAKKENTRLAILAEQEHKRLEEIVSNVPGIVWEMRTKHGAEQTIEFLSSYVEKMLGYSIEEVRSAPRFWLTLVPEEHREKVGRDTDRLIASGKESVTQFPLMAKDGRVLWAEAHLTPILNGTGSTVGMRGVTLDITERKRAERALRQSEEKTRDILRAIPDLMFLQTPDGVYLDYYAGTPSNLFAPPQEFLGKNMRDVLPAKLAEDFFRLFRRALASGETQLLEYRLPILGTERWFEARIVANAGNILSIVRDITDQKRAEEALTESETNYRAIFNAVNDAIFVHDTETGAIVEVNQVMCDMYGVTMDEARTLGPEVLSPKESPYTREAALEWIRKAAEGEPQVFEWQAADKSGRLFLVEVSLRRSVIRGKDRVLAVVRDITYRKRADEALRESEQRFINMADKAPVMIWVSGVDKLCTYFNQQWLDFTGHTIEQEIANGWTKVVHPDDFARCVEIYNTAFDLREPFTMEYRLRRTDGEFRWVLDSGAPRFAPGGEFLGYIGSCIDITERKAAEEALANLSGQLIRARENECARIARELHDDLNQRMALVSVELEQLRQSPPETHAELQKYLQQILNKTANISREIHRMSYDLHPSKLVHLGLVAAVESLCHEMRKTHGLKIKFINEGVPPDLSQDISLCIYRIAQECLNNVIRHSGSRDALVVLRGTEEEIRLRISDSGRGFDLKSSEIRNSLGLLSMRERLRLIDGTISIKSRPSHGTRIDARAPL